MIKRLEAERAIQCLNGKLALSKKLVVRWAHAQRFEPYRGDKNLLSSLEPSCSETEEQPTSLRLLFDKDVVFTEALWRNAGKDPYGSSEF
ncbi:probable RNA-binding protein 18 [Tachysurus ichikawai]